jgi:hypothetical protein
VLTSILHRRSGSLLGLVVALGLSAGVLAGSMHDHAVDDGTGAPADVCVLAAGNVLLGADAAEVCPTREPAVFVRAPIALEAPRTTTVPRRVSARAPPSTPSYPG